MTLDLRYTRHGTPRIYAEPQNEKYIYRHGQSAGWNVRIIFYGDGFDQPPTTTIHAYVGDTHYNGDEEKSKAAARRLRNSFCRDLGLPIPRITDRYRKHVKRHYLVAKGHTRRRHAKA